MFYDVVVDELTMSLFVLLGVVFVVIAVVCVFSSHLFVDTLA